MSALKSVIITLPPKGLVAKTPNIITTTGSGELVRPVTPAQKLSFTTSILMDHKIKMENGAKKQLQPSIKHMELPTDADVVFKQEEETAPARGKKRRLDHLTWEEKLQRKKLKNRVAAQTSRDRKKAKLDELEETVRMLRERNEMLVEECTILRTENQSLVSETERLKRNKEVVENKESKEQVCSMCQARVGCTAPALGSAAGWSSTNGTTSDTSTKRIHTPEDPDTLPPLEDLFSELQGDDYIERLEELAESLLREVTAEVETNSTQSNEQKQIKQESVKELNTTEKMVGEASSYVETSSPSESIVKDNLQCTSQIIPDNNSNTVPLVPTVTLNASGPITIAENVEIKEEPIHDSEMVYGTYDEATNCITIIYPEEDTTRLTVPQQQQYHQQLHSPTHSYDSMSPASLHSDDTDMGSVPPSKFDSTHSDGGYESHGSPASSVCGANSALTDLWHESFSELFPSLA